MRIDEIVTLAKSLVSLARDSKNSARDAEGKVLEVLLQFRKSQLADIFEPMYKMRAGGCMPSLTLTQEGFLAAGIDMATAKSYVTVHRPNPDPAAAVAVVYEAWEKDRLEKAAKAA